jgi:hypothetical protein
MRLPIWTNVIWPLVRPVSSLRTVQFVTHFEAVKHKSTPDLLISKKLREEVARVPTVLLYQEINIYPVMRKFEYVQGSLQSEQVSLTVHKISSL